MAAAFPQVPVHIHAAEQTKEVDDCIAALGARPVQWLLDNAAIDKRWCLIHATHMTDDETQRLAHSGAVAGLCPLTEGSLGDGIFNGEMFLEAKGRFGIGTDSNIQIDAPAELRQLEYSQRLKHRAPQCDDDWSKAKSTGRSLYTQCTERRRAGARRRHRCDRGGPSRRHRGAERRSSRTLPGASGDMVLDVYVFSAGTRPDRPGDIRRQYRW